MVATKKEKQEKQKIDFNQLILDAEGEPIMNPKSDGRKKEMLLLSLTAQQLSKLQEHLGLKTPQAVVTWLTTDLGIDGTKVEEEQVTLGSLVCNVVKGRVHVGDEGEEEKRPPAEAKAESKLRARIVKKIWKKKGKATDQEFAVIALKVDTAKLIKDLFWASKLEHVVFDQADEMIEGHSGIDDDDGEEEI